MATKHSSIDINFFGPENTISMGTFLERPEKFRAYSVKLVFSYIVKGIKIKITSKFRASRRPCFGDSKRIMSPEMRPKGLGTSEKGTPFLRISLRHRRACQVTARWLASCNTEVNFTSATRATPPNRASPATVIDSSFIILLREKRSFFSNVESKLLKS